MSYYPIYRRTLRGAPAAGAVLTCVGDSQSDEHVTVATTAAAHPQGLWRTTLAARYGWTQVGGGRGAGVLLVYARPVLSGATIGSMILDNAGIANAGAANGTPNPLLTTSFGDNISLTATGATTTVDAAGGVVSALHVTAAGSGYAAPIWRFQDQTTAARSAIGGDKLCDDNNGLGPLVAVPASAVNGLYANRATRIAAFMPAAGTPWVMTLWIGTNDSGGGVVTTAVFKTYYAALVAYILGLTNPPLLICMGLTVQVILPQFSPYANNAAFTQAIAEVALDNHLLFVPLGQFGLAAMVDGIHPTARSQGLITDEISRAIG